MIDVPIGTQVWHDDDGERALIADLKGQGEIIEIVRGGRGGRGNARFTSSTSQSPVLAEEGEAGEEAELTLELKLLADVGIIGLPNAGKSSLLSASSSARPKIADYPFTTIEPVLGVVESRGESFVALDIPGLIEDAHEGKGLGDQFLQHIERTRVLIHLLDGSSQAPNKDWQQVNDELRFFNETLLSKPQIIAVNKVDLPWVRERMEELKSSLNPLERPLFFISAVTREGLDSVWSKALELLKEVRKEGEELIIEAVPVLRPRPVRKPTIEVVRGQDAFVVSLPRAERLAAMVDPMNWRATLQLYRALDRMGVVKALEEVGVQSGDVVRIGKFEMEWQ